MNETEEKDEAYRQRNYLVAALTRLFPSGIRPTNIEGWEPDWHGCVYIDLPTGQISYHYHASHAFLFDDLPPYNQEWDGHDKDAVHKRLLALSSYVDGVDDMAYRFGCILDHATGGRMSKTNYTKEAMYSEIDDYINRQCRIAYKEGCAPE